MILLSAAARDPQLCKSSAVGKARTQQAPATRSSLPAWNLLLPVVWALVPVLLKDWVLLFLLIV